MGRVRSVKNIFVKVIFFSSLRRISLVLAQLASKIKFNFNPIDFNPIDFHPFSTYTYSVQRNISAPIFSKFRAPICNSDLLAMKLMKRRLNEFSIVKGVVHDKYKHVMDNDFNDYVLIKMLYCDNQL